MGQPLASQKPDRSGTHCSHFAESNDNQDVELSTLAEQAERCRRLAGATYNREVSEILGNMADGYERTAAELSSRKAN